MTAMSWDAWLVVQVDGQEIELSAFDYTHNTNSMIREAGFPEFWDGLNNMSAPAALAALTRVVSSMISDPARFEAMNPPNGWGDYMSLLHILVDMAVLSARYPSGAWKVSG